MSDQKEIKLLFKHPEIRLRYVAPDVIKEFSQIAAMLRTNTVPATVLKLIARYREDQTSIRELQARNSELHRGIARYVEREAEMKELVSQFIQGTGKFNKMILAAAAEVLKKFSKSGAKRKPAARSAAAPGKKNAPHKKAGKKKAAVKQGRFL
jgi:hypothetical protein